MSKKMEEEIRRENFVTPINYLELVQGYVRLGCGVYGWEHLHPLPNKTPSWVGGWVGN
jgi:hypothetical protein